MLIKKSILFSFVLMQFLFGSRISAYGEETPRKETRPNIIIILIDDMGFSDIGCYGSEIPTPNLDSLAAKGLRFTQFYNCARCSPTRASLITGLYPHQAGMGFLDGLVKPEGTGTFGRLLPRCVTIAEVLAPAGYLPIICGKWHLGQQHGCNPRNRGFERNLTSPWGEVYFPSQKMEGLRGQLFLNGKGMPINSPELGRDWWSPELFSRYALKFIDDSLAEKKPFFLYLPHVAAHFPLMAPQEEIARFRGKYLQGWDRLREARYKKQQAMGLIDPRWPLAPRPEEVAPWDSLSDKEKDRFDHIMALYAAVISGIDQSVGQLVAGLKERNILDNTAIFFLADNGGNGEGGPAGQTTGGPIGSATSHVKIGMSWGTLCNTPFRRYKHFTHEGGIATPLIVHWPKGVSSELEGKWETQPGHLIDLMATCVDLARADYPKTFKGADILPMEGVSLRPAFSGKNLKRENPIFWEHEGNRAIREGKWKLVQRFRSEWELFDMEADRTEQHNLSQEHPELAEQLSKKWLEWEKRAFVDRWEKPYFNDWGGEAPFKKALTK